MGVTVRIAACKGSMNEECLVSVLQHSTLNTSLLFVHTARRIKELNRDNEAAGRLGRQPNSLDLTMMKS